MESILLLKITRHKQKHLYYQGNTLNKVLELISNVCVARRATGSSLSNEYTQVIDLELETNPSITAIFARYVE
jgi:hypothetical protein